jgi:hypothetical protein
MILDILDILGILDITFGPFFSFSSSYYFLLFLPFSSLFFPFLPFSSFFFSVLLIIPYISLWFKVVM